MGINQCLLNYKMSNKDIKVPNIGEFKDVEVIEVLVSIGQLVKKNDPLITIESDKSSVEIPSLYEGEVKKLNIKVIDGKISTVFNNKKNNIDINFKNIDSKNIFAENIFLNFQNYLENDYVFNLNSLMLNSGYEINIENNQHAKIFISNSISEKDSTIFQKNIITCSKNSNVFIVLRTQN